MTYYDAKDAEITFQKQMTFYVTHDLSFDVIFEKSLKMMTMMMTMKDKSKKRELDVLALKNQNNTVITNTTSIIIWPTFHA